VLTLGFDHGLGNGVKATACGFRSAFRDWAGNVSNFPREITETSGRKDKGADLICACAYGF